MFRVAIISVNNVAQLVHFHTLYIHQVYTVKYICVFVTIYFSQDQ